MFTTGVLIGYIISVGVFGFVLNFADVHQEETETQRFVLILSMYFIAALVVGVANPPKWRRSFFLGWSQIVFAVMALLGGISNPNESSLVTAGRFLIPLLAVVAGGYSGRRLRRT